MGDFDPEKDAKVESQVFDLLPLGQVVLYVDSAECAKSKKGDLMYALQLKPHLLEGHYGSIFLYMREDRMKYVLLSFCDAAGISIKHVFPPALRGPSGSPNSFMDIEVPHDGEPMRDNLLCRNMLGRVVIGISKHEKGQDGVTMRSALNVFANPPFLPYILETGELYQQPAPITDAVTQGGAPTPVVQIRPPSEVIEVDEPIPLEDDIPFVDS